MFDTALNAGGAGEEKTPRTFKEFAAADIHNVFLNLDELAERCDIRFGGALYRGVPVSLQSVSSQARRRRGNNFSGAGAGDHAQGLSRSAKILYCAISDLDCNLPEQGQRFEVGRGGQFRQFYVEASSLTAGMLRVELEAVTASG